jgi:CMP-N,N'-diacetyllegionaminic acid synthase
MLDFEKKVIALIPARGGSKGVIRKNLRKVSGRVLMDFTLEAAKLSRHVDAVYVSSEDEEILNFARASDVEVICRPAEYASDTASAVEVVTHFINELPSKLRQQDPYIVYLQPTSPLRTSKHIDDALESMVLLNNDKLVSVTGLEASPFKSFKINQDGNLESLFDEEMSNARRQDLPTTYIPNGAIYVFRIFDFIEKGGFPSNGSIPFIMSKNESLDIDTEADIERLEQILGER